MKKLISTLTALTLTLSSMAALSSNAIYICHDSNSEYYNYLVENYTLIDKETVASTGLGTFDCNKFFYKPSSLVGVKTISTVAMVTFTDSSAITEANKMLEDYYDTGETDFHYAVTELQTNEAINDRNSLKRQITQLPNQKAGISLADAKKICKVLKEKNLITDFAYVDIYQMFKYAYSRPTYYQIDKADEETMSLIHEYVEENLLDWQVEIDDGFYGWDIDVEAYREDAIEFDLLGDMTFEEWLIKELEDGNIPKRNYFDVNVVPAENATPEEYFAVAKQLYENIGILSNCGGYVEAAASNEAGNSIDMYNAVLGDANCDGAVNIADSTLILQAITNADEYRLSEQGKYNADVYGNCDGVSAADALEIQKLDANVIDNFE